MTRGEYTQAMADAVLDYGKAREAHFRTPGSSYRGAVEPYLCRVFDLMRDREDEHEQELEALSQEADLTDARLEGLTSDLRSLARDVL